MRTLAVVAVVILTFGATCSSFAQAVAEGAMVHANSAAATTKVGSALGNALSNVMSGSAEKMESLSAAKVEHVPHASRKALASGKGEQSSGPLVITSIRGMSKPCIAAQPSVQDASNSSDRSKTKADASAHAQMAPASASPAQACGIAAGGLSPSKSVVNLGFPR
jgi:hypothetical protein